MRRETTGAYRRGAARGGGTVMVAHGWVLICATALIVQASRGWRHSDGV
jgi:hypothetical protein